MAHGGKRPGAGRKSGVPQKKPSHRKITRERILQVAADGITPLEVMLGTMRALWAEDNAIGACTIAEKVAPYLHPRLTSVAHSGNIGDIDPRKLNDADIDRAIAAEEARLASLAASEREKTPGRHSDLTH